MVSTAAGPGYDLELKLAEMKINGFVVLPQVVPKAQIAAMHEAFLPLLDAVVARDPGPSSRFSQEVGDPHVGMGRCQQAGGGPTAGAIDGSGHRYTVTVPWVKPFADPLLYENPAVLAFLVSSAGDAAAWCCLVLLPGAAWCCLVLPGAAWCCLLLITSVC
eukprot:SAG31_NODE_530_length_14420_cov_4.259968_4_plen_161_part_00